MYPYQMQKMQYLQEERAWYRGNVDQATQTADKAAARVDDESGKRTRRLIVLSCLFAISLASFILPFFGHSTFAEVTQQNPEALFGLIPASTKKFFVEIPGYLLVEENRQALLAIISFYFGASVRGDK